MRSRLALLATLCALATTSAVACAQGGATPIHPGSPEVDAARVGPRSDTMAVMVLDGVERPVASLVLRTDRITTPAGAAVSRVERMVSTDGREVMADSFTLAAATLAPLAYESRGENGEASLVFDGLAVRGKLVAEGKPRNVAIRLAAPAFAGNQIDLLLSALPLEVGRAYSWRMVREDEAHEEEIVARVTASERVRTLSGGVCDAWRVETRTGGDTNLYWVEKGTGEMLQFEGGNLRFRILRHRACPSEDGPGRSSRR